MRCAGRGTRPEEPDFVAGLVREATPIIAKAWRHLLGRHRVHVSMLSVYCHQTPQVHFQGMQKTACELGDLLFAHFHSDQSGTGFQNAILLQAKVAQENPFTGVGPKDDQLRLYQSWPDFEYRRSGKALNGLKRAVVPKTPHTGAQYMLIDNRRPHDPVSGLLGIPGTYPIGVSMPDTFLHHHNDLGSELADFLLMRSGRAFCDLFPHQAIEDGWSQIVWDLLRVALTKAFNRKKSEYGDAPRRSDILQKNDGLCFASTSSGRFRPSVASKVLGREEAALLYSSDGEAEPPQEREYGDGFSDDQGGVSVVLLETASGMPRIED